ARPTELAKIKLSQVPFVWRCGGECLLEISRKTKIPSLLKNRSATHPSLYATVSNFTQINILERPWSQTCRFRRRSESARAQVCFEFARNRQHVRFGSRADISPCRRNVRFTPESGHELSVLGDAPRRPFTRNSNVLNDSPGR